MTAVCLRSLKIRAETGKFTHSCALRSRYAGLTMEDEVPDTVSSPFLLDKKRPPVAQVHPTAGGPRNSSSIVVSRDNSLKCPGKWLPVVKELLTKAFIFNGRFACASLRFALKLVRSHIHVLLDCAMLV